MLYVKHKQTTTYSIIVLSIDSKIYSCACKIDGSLHIFVDTNILSYKQKLCPTINIC